MTFSVIKYKFNEILNYQIFENSEF